MKKNVVITSDAVELIRSLPKKSIKLIITDPPYGIAYYSGYYKGKNPHSPIAHDWNFQIGDLYQAADRVLTDDGAMYLFTRWDVYPIWFASLPVPFTLKNCIVWMKNNWSAGDLKGNFGNQYELLLFITKKEHKIRGKRWSNIWPFPRIPARKLRVASEKPVKLLERAIISSSDIGDIVLDPYCGSGSTGEAAIGCNRAFILGDIDKEMVRLASERLGLSAVDTDILEDVKLPECPIMKIEPPEPHLWGLHPEDLADILRIEKNRKEQKNLFSLESEKLEYHVQGD